ncbi:Glyoxalase-like domain [Carpediemonas membranifera]|uniref:Glyoxalase-like domain n=1 Tax=Carpediemonas membranifera TaxID=201153 RepID=A0A8J6ASQ4_9EUKA|nr:Glyoxalase-like domain [Carpediemonas membranifera]|eukprot:KAG9391400.1 Glyoxalase-like domain [Carpediemonas membranifera]
MTIFRSTLIAVTDMERSKQFYKDVLDAEIIADFGANVTLTGNISLQTIETWAGFIQQPDTSYINFGNASELYYEEDDIESFVQRLEAFEVDLVHPLYVHEWGQRAVRFYDPDGHIIEVAEGLNAVVARFLDSGMTLAETARRMGLSEDFIRTNVMGEE